MRSGRIIYLAFVLSSLVAQPLPARADAHQSQNFAVWNRMQACAKQAAKRFPDYTPEGKAQREAARQECLRANHLPVTQPVPSPAR